MNTFWEIGLLRGEIVGSSASGVRSIVHIYVCTQTRPHAWSLAAEYFLLFRLLVHLMTFEAVVVVRWDWKMSS